MSSGKGIRNISTLEESLKITGGIKLRRCSLLRVGDRTVIYMASHSKFSWNILTSTSGMGLGIHVEQTGLLPNINITLQQLVTFTHMPQSCTIKIQTHHDSDPKKATCFNAVKRMNSWLQSHLCKPTVLRTWHHRFGKEPHQDHVDHTWVYVAWMKGKGTVADSIVQLSISKLCWWKKLTNTSDSILEHLHETCLNPLVLI